MNIRDHIDEPLKKKTYGEYRCIFWVLLFVVAVLCIVLPKMPILIACIDVVLLFLAWGAHSYLRSLRHLDAIVAVLEEHPSYSRREIAIASALSPTDVFAALSDAVLKKILCDFDPSTIPAESKEEDKNFALRVDFARVAGWRSGNIIFFVLSPVVMAVLWFVVLQDRTVLLFAAAFLWALFALFSWLSLKTCKAFKKSLAVLLTHPNDTFTELAPHVGHTPGVVRLAFENAVKKGILPGLEVDVDADRLIETPIPQGERASVTCPNCGANVTISTKNGGLCEYCGTYLQGIE